MPARPPIKGMSQQKDTRPQVVSAPHNKAVAKIVSPKNRFRPNPETGIKWVRIVPVGKSSHKNTRKKKNILRGKN